MKRDPRLRDLSSDHHQALVLARHVSREPEWSAALGEALAARFEQELEPHFHIEEELLLPALRSAGEAELALRTQREHDTLRSLVRQAAEGSAVAARDFAELLTLHVRFEERQLFPTCETALNDAELDAVATRTAERQHS
ncbi:MAG: hemerythrin domain-containing protein [Polyangiaceae bacterium]|nr:hemerythrin domain-containing protein [Polyangiaceae bacterium]